MLRSSSLMNQQQHWMHVLNMKSSNDFLNSLPAKAQLSFHIASAQSVWPIVFLFSRMAKCWRLERMKNCWRIKDSMQNYFTCRHRDMCSPHSIAVLSFRIINKQLPIIHPCENLAS